MYVFLFLFLDLLLSGFLADSTDDDDDERATTRNERARLEANYAHAVAPEEPAHPHYRGQHEGDRELNE